MDPDEGKGLVFSFWEGSGRREEGGGGGWREHWHRGHKKLDRVIATVGMDPDEGEAWCFPSGRG
jgi:hypothetical protein